MQAKIYFLSFSILLFAYSSFAQNFIESSSQLGFNASAGLNSSGGISLFDFNYDGYADITIGTANGNPILIFENDGFGNFIQSTINIPNYTKQNQVIWVDVENDGDADLFIASKQSPNGLYINDGQFGFTENFGTNGLATSNTNSYGAIFGDVDYDGLLDLFVSNRLGHSILYKNIDNGNFSDVTIPAGLGNQQTLNFCGAFFDFDKDGDIDLFKSNDRMPTNQLYRNEGNFTFSDISASYALDLSGDAMSSSIADVNNNGLLDIYFTNSNVHPYSGNTLHINQYPLPFYNAQNNSNTNLNKWCWGSSFADFNNNGWQDLYVSNSDYVDSKNELYFNNGNSTFSIQAASNMLNDTLRTQSCSVADFDLDGNMDIVVGTFGSDNFQLWHNNINNNFNYIKISLEGTVSNTAGIGSWINVYTPLQNYTRFSQCGTDYLAQHSQIHHIGINNQNSIDSIIVRWPSGIIDKIDNPPVNQTLNIIENSNPIATIIPGSNNNTFIPLVDTTKSVARNWMDLLLESIRNDFARPTVHARNLFHSSILMYDCWAAYQNVSSPYFLNNTLNNFNCAFNGIPASTNIVEDREKAISYAMYRLLQHRFANSPAYSTMAQEYDFYMSLLNFNTSDVSIDYTSGNPAALGNYIAEQIIQYGLQDGSNEQNDYANLYYQPINPPLNINQSGNSVINYYNSWQPLTLDQFIDQSGNIIPFNTPDFLSPEWGAVYNFALQQSDLSIYQRNGNNYYVYHDLGAPPLFENQNAGQSTIDYQWGFSLVAAWSSHLDAADNTMWDISPASLGNIQSYPSNIVDYPSFYNWQQGGDASLGHPINPKTGLAYSPQMVKRADYARVLAEFWADGPDSETPPGHWFVLLNDVSDHPLFQKKYKGQGTTLTPLEWDVKAYFSLGGAMHDAAVAAWSLKGWYDYIRPVSALRAMAELGQCTDSNSPNYNIGGLPLIPGYIEQVKFLDPLIGNSFENLWEVKIKAWKGPNYINDPLTDEAGVDWILAKDWMPYQRPSFVTPPFAGFVSGHSTFSRAAAEVMTLLTGDPFFPGGIAEYTATANEFLVFEEGPSQDVVLQWATYRDASDQCSLSRIWGGIHPPADDIPGRLIGEKIGICSFDLAEYYINGKACQQPNISLPNQIIPKVWYGAHNITAQGNVQTNDVNFEAKNSIILNAGFETYSHKNFSAEIIECD